MHETIPELDRRDLRKFGLTMAIVIAVLFGLLLPWWLEHEWQTWPWAIAAVFMVWATAAPGTLRPVYKGWMRFGQLMGRIVTPIILTLTYVIAIVPTGLVMRAIGRDPMSRRFDPEAESYRVDSEVTAPEQLKNPF